MSVVAVRKYPKKIVIGADSIRVSFGSSQEKDKLCKLYRIGKEMIMGMVGDCAVGSLFREFLSNHAPKANDEHSYIELLAEFQSYLKNLDRDLNLKNNSFIIVRRGRVFFIDNFFVREIRDFYAMGAGMDFANAALYLGADVRKAIKTACELSIYCEAPINVITIPI